MDIDGTVIHIYAFGQDCDLDSQDFHDFLDDLSDVVVRRGFGNTPEEGESDVNSLVTAQPFSVPQEPEELFGAITAGQAILVIPSHDGLTNREKEEG